MSSAPARFRSIRITLTRLDLHNPGSKTVITSAARLAPLATVLLALALRVWGLGYQELRGDEAFSFFLSQNSWADILRTTLTIGEPHPLGYPYLERTWLSLAGHSEFALRFISVWFSVLAVALLYQLGRRLKLSAAISLVAALLLAVSPYAIWHSQDARMYSMSLGLTLASSILAWEVLTRPRWTVDISYVLVTWLALNTHLLGIFVVLAQNVFWACCLAAALIRSRQPACSVMSWIICQVALGLSFLPWLMVAIRTMQSYRGTGETTPLSQMVVRSLAVFAAGETLPVGQRLLIAGLAAALLLIGAYRLASCEETRRPAGFLGAYLLVPLAISWLSALNRPLFNERYFIDGVPAFYLLLAAAVVPLPGLTTATKPRGVTAYVPVILAGLALLLVAGLGALPSLGRYYTDPTYSKTRSWRQLVAALDRLTAGIPAGEARLVQNYPDPALWYYYTGPVQHVVLPPTPHNTDRTRAEVSKMAEAGVNRVIIVLEPAWDWDDSGIAQAALSHEYTMVEAPQVGRWPVQIYARPSKTMTTTIPVNTTFKGGLALAGMTVQNPSTPPGSPLVVNLTWRAPTAGLAGREKVSLQLLDASGALASQVDRPLHLPAGATSTASYALLLPENLHAGTYRLIAIVYDPGRPGAPRLATEANEDSAGLGTIEIP